MTPLVSVEDVSVRHRRGGEEVRALDGVSFSVAAGELVGLVGPSGSGKTTLLNIIAGWERPAAGRLRWEGTEVSSDSLAALSWTVVAIVPQALGLLDELSIRDNLALPIRLGLPRGADRTSAGSTADLLDRFDIASVAARLAREASLGQQQRAAVARALACAPALVLADEPTAHQDVARSALVFAALRAAADDGTACVVATHDSAHLDACDRVVALRSGRRDPS